MYRYARTRNRVHRVVIEGGRAFKVENCNLDDVGFLNLVDIIPEGTRCKWCWAGYVEPTPEQKAAESAENAKREESLKEEIPPNAKAIPLVTSTRRMAGAVLVGALLLGAATGVMASPDVDPPLADDTKELVDDLRGRIDELFVQVRILSVDINGHSHEENDPIVVVIPTPLPEETFGPPIILPEPSPTNDSQVINPSPFSPTSPPVSRTVIEERVIREERTVIVIPPVIAPAPTPAPTPRPCLRPGVANGVFDRCRWPQLR